MSSDLEMVFRRWQNAKAGFKLAAIVPFGLPVWEYELKVQVFAQTQYPLTREFLLRSTNAGIDNVPSISEFLGLEQELVGGAVVEEMSAGNIAYSNSGKLQLTSRGVDSLDAMQFGKLELTTLTVQVDEMTNRTVSYSPVAQISDFPALTRNMVSSAELVKSLPAKRTKRPAGDFFDVNALNGLHNLESRKVVEVAGLTNKRAVRKFKPSWLLIYIDAAEDVSVELLLDGLVSDDHHFQVNANDFLESIDVVVEVPEEAPSVLEALKDLDLLASPAANKIVEIAREIPIVEIESELDQDSDRLVVSPAHLNFVREGMGKFLNQEYKPSMISVFEHGELLIDAVRYAEKRILIISPWIRSAVVNKQFVENIAKALRRGVDFTIAFGYEGGMGNDEWAVEQLRGLVGQGLKLLKHENTHAKILLVDNCAVMTSFNWLSFKGDPARTYRMEEGMQCRSKELSDQMFDALQDKLAKESAPA